MKSLALITTFILITVLTGCATTSVQPKASSIAMPNDSALASAKDISITEKPIIRMCIYSGRVYTQTANGDRNYL
jgi:hypothetical protein